MPIRSLQLFPKREGCSGDDGKMEENIYGLNTTPLPEDWLYVDTKGGCAACAEP